jgi:hypothetical protein
MSLPKRHMGERKVGMAMEIRFNITGPERRKLAQAVSELLEAPLSYKGAPTFAYQAGGYSIDKNGTLKGKDDRKLVADLSGLHSFVSQEKTYDSEPAADIMDSPPAIGLGRSARSSYDSDHNEEGPQGSECEDRSALTIEIPSDGFSEEAFVNLENLVASKATLIRKAIGAGVLPIERTEDTLRFPWFKYSGDSEIVAAYSCFVSALCAAAREHKRISAREKNVENEKFAFRVFLIRLGLVGDGFKKARKILLRNLDGNTAYRDGRPAAKGAGVQ